MSASDRCDELLAAQQPVYATRFGLVGFSFAAGLGIKTARPIVQSLA